MNIIQSIQEYINKMVDSVSGMKILILDAETTQIISLVYGQTQLIQKGVYLFDKIANTKTSENMPHMKAICFLRPTQENIYLLKEELLNPKYGEYYLFFSNTLRNSYLEDLAQNDEHEVVSSVHEYYADYFAINPELFALKLGPVVSVKQNHWVENLTRMTESLTSLLLSIKKKPFVRYQRKSEMCQRLAQEVVRSIQQEPDLFSFRMPDVPPVLLILDRTEDPITPLLTQWTYQSMVHNILRLNNNRVDISHIRDQGYKQEQAEIVLSPSQDQFFQNNMHVNFGDLGVAIAQLVDVYKKKTDNSKKIDSLNDIRDFLSNYPEYRKFSGNVSKHVMLMEELSRIVEKRHLMELSEVEQEFACRHDASHAWKKLVDIISDQRFQQQDKLRLALLFIIRHEESGRLNQLMELLQHHGFSSQDIQILSDVITYAGQAVRTSDLSNVNVFSRTKDIMKRTIKGVDNIYTEHEPLLASILDKLVKGKLSDTRYPFLSGSLIREKTKDVIVFIVGGVTFEEACCINEIKKANPNVNFLLGGSDVPNADDFIKQIQTARKYS